MIENQIKHKRGIRHKVISIICLSTLIVMSLGIGLGYFFGFNALHDMVGDIHRKLSQLLASDVTQRLEVEIARIRGYAAEPLWKDAATKGGGENKPASNMAGDRLRAIVGDDHNIAEITIIDRSGEPVASSEKASKIYSDYDKRCMKLLSDGKRNIFIGDIGLNETSSKWLIPVYIPVRDAGGSLSGIFKAGLSVKNFFSPLGNFKVDNTGHAVVIDGKGNIMFHPGITQTNIRLASDRDYNRLLSSKGKYAVIFDPNIHKKRIFVAFSEITPPALTESGKIWRVLIDEDTKEVFAPLTRIVPGTTIAIMILLVVMIVIGFVFSGLLVKPIETLYSAAVEIRKGNWDYNIDIRTGDEIEQFADAFKDMIANIKSKREELIDAKAKLEDLSKDLEIKVAQRTSDLVIARNKINDYAKDLEKAVIVKSDFIATASHELRTPLAAIREGIGIVLDEKTGPINKEQKEFLDMAKRNLDRLGRLIDDILDFQKLEHSKMEMKFRDNDINDVVREACHTMAHLAKDKSLELTTELADNIPKVKFDKDKIIQVLTNLINNAIKFTQKGSIKVLTSKEDNIIMVSIRDTGIGIRGEDLPRLFQKFTQLDKGLGRRPGGTGLGLTISREIIERHGGKIWAESKFGEGTTFHFFLPIKERRDR